MEVFRKFLAGVKLPPAVLAMEVSALSVLDIALAGLGYLWAFHSSPLVASDGSCLGVAGGTH